MSGLVILVTGGALGAGAATAKAFKAKGAMPVLIDCDAAQLKNAASELNAPSFCVDVTDYAACQAAVAQTLASYGRLNVVWANTGIAFFGPLLSKLHTPLSERALLQAALEVEKLVEQTIASSGVKASPVAPRKFVRAVRLN